MEEIGLHVVLYIKGESGEALQKFYRLHDRLIGSSTELKWYTEMMVIAKEKLFKKSWSCKEFSPDRIWLFLRQFWISRVALIKWYWMIEIEQPVWVGL